MALSELRLARDALVLTRGGPALVRNVEPGTDVLGVHGGAHKWAKVSALRLEDEPTGARRVATVAGLAVLADDVKVEGSSGPAPVGQLCQGDRLELVHPTDLAPFGPGPSPLRGLPSLTTVIPTENGCADAVVRSLDELLQHAGLQCKKLVGGRWMAIQVSRARSVDWSWDEEADLVSSLYAWDVDAHAPSTLRLRDDDHQGRELLLGALIASRRGFVARASPAFSPVELRIAETEDSWPAYSPISSCIACLAETLVMSVAPDRWSVIADLLILRPRRVR